MEHAKNKSLERLSPAVWSSRGGCSVKRASRPETIWNTAIHQVWKRPLSRRGNRRIFRNRSASTLKFQRRARGPRDIICGDWGKVHYPLVVGHELSGEVVAVGSSVSKFTVGARVGVGTMVNSCRVCTVARVPSWRGRDPDRCP